MCEFHSSAVYYQICKFVGGADPPSSPPSSEPTGFVEEVLPTLSDYEWNNGQSFDDLLENSQRSNTDGDLPLAPCSPAKDGDGSRQGSCIPVNTMYSGTQSSHTRKKKSKKKKDRSAKDRKNNTVSGVTISQPRVEVGTFGN